MLNLTAEAIENVRYAKEINPTSVKDFPRGWCFITPHFESWQDGRCLLLVWSFPLAPCISLSLEHRAQEWFWYRWGRYMLEK